jgi:colanic acid/amylovoran biosynthesis protein
LWGATVGPFSADPSYEEYAAGQLSRIDLILCRDHDSVEYLRRIGVTENVSFAMDPAFVLSSDASASQAVADFASGAVALNISPLYARYAGVSIEELAARACGLVRGICADTGRRVLLVPHVVLPTQDDHSFAVTVLSELRDLGDKVAVAPRDFSAGQLKWCVSRCAAIIAARTHLTIAGFSSSVPTISLGYSAKAAAINRDVYGHDRWVIAADAFTVQTVASLLMQLLDEADDVRRVLSAKQQDFAASAASAAQDVASLVSRTGAGAVRT